ncbi:MAG TPA: AmmeMemoRadiSam system protein B [Methanomicrobiales archaeon]|nr:AmmeMemoRadiSam system protein B [Methanomicrobiales archaeon]
MGMKVRSCSVAGQFYPRDPHHLEQLVAGYLEGREPREGVVGIVSPHAGYPYSGAVAGEAFAALDPDFSGTFVVVGPSHRGFLTCASAIPWETPLGIVDTDADFVRELGIEVDEFSHQGEHSLEVQMPFIKYRFPRARIAPVMMGDQGPGSAAAIAAKIGKAWKATGREIRIVASSDFSHYVPAEVARKDDLFAIGALSNLDTAGFYHRVAERGVSACGYGPIATLCLEGKEMGAARGELLTYRTSGDVTGDFEQVVGYAAIAVM